MMTNDNKVKIKLIENSILKNQLIQYEKFHTYVIKVGEIPQHAQCINVWILTILIYAAIRYMCYSLINKSLNKPDNESCIPIRTFENQSSYWWYISPHIILSWLTKLSSRKEAAEICGFLWRFSCFASKTCFRIYP